jgi:hypothetical protein
MPIYHPESAGAAMSRATAIPFLATIVLGLVGCNSKPTGADPVAAQVEALKTLKELGAEVDPAEPTAEQPVARVVLDGEKVNDDAMTFVGRLPKLRMLRLRNTSVSAAGLAKIGSIVNLEALDLAGSKKIDDAALAQIGHLAALQSLILNDTAVTDAGMESVARLNGLKVLELVNTAVGDAGVEKLKTLIVLEELRLEGTKVGDAGLEKLNALPALKTIYVNGTAVTAGGVEKVKQLRKDKFRPELNIAQ